MAKTSDVQRDLDALKSDVENLRKHTVKTVSDASNFTVETSKNVVENAAKTIKENPVASLAGAVGVGVVLGGIVKRLFRKKKR
jgi:ElaB/YqjD/DUF883 family membrane-anchored ribosome-binding protein